MAAADTVEIESGNGSPQGSVIWLHGLGADGHDFEPIVPELRLPGALGLRFIFPHAPLRPVTINGGMTMRSWFDILTFDRDSPADEAGIRASTATVAALVQRERQRGIATDRIVLAGFSQGGAIAIHAALRSEHRLAGLMGLSTYLPLASELQADVARNAASGCTDLPVFMAHGSLDPVLPLVLGQESAAFLEASGYRVEWHEYPMAHAVCAREIDDIRAWLLGVYGVE